MTKKGNLELLEFPESDLFKASIKKVIKGLTQVEDSPLYQDELLCELYNYYIEFEDTPERNAVLLKISELRFFLDEFYATPDL